MSIKKKNEAKTCIQGIVLLQNIVSFVMTWTCLIQHNVLSNSQSKNIIYTVKLIIL